MNELNRRALNIGMVTALVCASTVARADGPKASNPKYSAGHIVADWSATPPAKPPGCWKPTQVKDPKTGEGKYQLANATPDCTATLGLTKVAVTLDPSGKVTTIGGQAPSGTVHTVDVKGNSADAPFKTLVAPGDANEALKNGILFADDNGAYLPLSIAQGGAAPAKPLAAPAADTPKLRVDNKKFVADWKKTPNPDCWTATGTPDAAGAGTYALKNASTACTSALGMTPVDVTIDGSGNLTFAGTAQKGNIYSLDDKGNALEIGALTSPSFAKTQAAAGLLLADDLGVYLVHDVKNKELDAAKCEWPKLAPDHNAHVDVDLPRSSVEFVPERNVVLPNQALTVRVCHVRGDDVTVAWGGTRGLTTTSTNNQGQAPTTQSDEKGKPKAPPQQTPVDISEVSFAPRQPGNADVTVTLGTGPNAKTLTIELEVDTLYWGSIRFGLGTSFDVGSTWKTYAISTTAGGFQPEITESRSAVGFELVSGFAPYLFEILFADGHGRSYTGGSNYFVAPFVGFGVVGGGTNQTGVQALSSFHAGMEFEFSQSFSIALTFVERRGQGLDQRYHVGSPVASGMTVSDVTQDSWSPGLGVIVNASPSFLQFATGGGSGTTTKTTSNSTTSSSTQTGTNTSTSNSTTTGTKK